MLVSSGLHCLRLPYQAAEGSQSYVNVFLLMADRVYIIDTGVAPAYDEIVKYIEGQGRSLADVAAVLLTHANADHLGCAAKIKAASNCTILASNTERPFIEDIEALHKARPFPNSRDLTNEPVKLDATSADKDILSLEPGVTITVYETPGHSDGHLAFYWQEERALFTGGAVPVADQVPVYTDVVKSIASIEKMLKLRGVEHYLGSYDRPRSLEEGQTAMKEALDLLKHLQSAVRLIHAADPNPETLPGRVARQLGKENFASDPLFVRSVLSHLRTS